MKKFQRLLGIFLVAAASAGLLAACGDDGGEAESCVADTDCAVGDICVDEICVQECAADADCLADEECVERPGGGESYCEFTGGNNGGDLCQDVTCDAGETCDPATGECVADQECQTNEDCPGDQICNAENMCETIQQNFFFSSIADASADNPQACDETDPGSDIYGVELTKVDSEGNTITGWAHVLFVGIVIDSNNQTQTGVVLDGNQPGLDVDECPEGGFSSDTVVSLGCGGEVLVEFVTGDDTNGDGIPDDRLQVEDGDTITVFEYGATCGGDTEDSWRVSICDASENEVLGGTCNGLVLGTDAQKGINSVTVDGLEALSGGS